MFAEIEPRAVDPIMAMMAAFRADPRELKVDLIVGVYKDDAGRVPVMRAVKGAEAVTLKTEDTKTYVGIAGDAELNERTPRMLLGDGHPALAAGRIGAVQTVGGSGALRVACDLIASTKPGATIWVSSPTWANHVPVARAAGLTIREYPYFRASDRGLDFDGMLACLTNDVAPGDVVLLHACCHNPTGVDLKPAQWEEITQVIADRGLFPFVDCAYQGLGHGLEEDVAGLRHLAAHVPEMLIASSYSKNFGIYRERTGGLTVLAETPDQLKPVMAQLNATIRANYSMPPNHGARIVAEVFADDALHADWEAELTEVRERIAQMRRELRAKLEERQVTADLSFVTDQVGMFSYTGFTPEQVQMVREEYGIYMASDGRINVAALCSTNIDHVADGFAAALR
ncbi:aromatic amino acid transaminase [Pseudaestuariivita atlantica]|uniref:Aromatic amino acid aminotransferase n=1 Tax=Pseudaestuariivita atlantica TaxID=1317121 RepID=A0A0L1JSF5_9RHOB|nr:amino acid aminotransferase [Pseudaestuariivita atlantica]KNG94328.1 aromatic amino acid aminotransferase [Pseudaestuariivita atlantica]